MTYVNLVTNNKFNMDESGISLGFDIDDVSTIVTDDFLQNLSSPDMDTHNFYEIISKPAPLSESPSFKTELVKSRTNVKQQLMRDQLQKEKERLKAEEANEKANSDRANSLKVPINLQNVVLPQNVLHVTTGLKNPTKYHILEKQKNQVLQYLSSSQQDSLVRKGNIAHLTPQNLSGPSTSYSIQAPIASPSVLSVTSGGTSDAEDVLEGILSYEESELEPQGNSLYGSNASLEKTRDTSSCPSGDRRFKQENYIGSEDTARDRMKKDTHNMIERRRRYNINDRIKELGELLPQRHEPHYDMVRDSRSNKGTILKSSVDYIKMLKSDVNKMKQMEQDNRSLQEENRKLLLRIQQLEIEARANGVTLGEETWKVKSPAEIINQFIRPNSRPRVDMPDVVSEAAYVQYDESMEDAVMPDPVLAMTAHQNRLNRFSRDVEME